MNDPKNETIFLPNGNIYVGEAVNKISSGRGREISPLGLFSYNGFYKNGERFGLGEFTKD